ncbi:MAG TPA: hypothetical protein VG454_12080, partial [Gemmatimonadales bacterium]|nr:hypothetical protein [Gemmatimonadales bacterium]
MRRLISSTAVVLVASVATRSAAQQLTPAERSSIDSSAVAILDATGAPSASIAIVRKGQIVYEQGYGNGRIAPNTPASP